MIIGALIWFKFIWSSPHPTPQETSVDALEAGIVQIFQRNIDFHFVQGRAIKWQEPDP